MEESEELKKFKKKNNYQKESGTSKIFKFLIIITVIAGIIYLINFFCKPKMQYINVEYNLTETIIYIKITNVSINTKFGIDDFYIQYENKAPIKASKIENTAQTTIWGDDTSYITTRSSELTIKITFNQIFGKDITPNLYYLGKELKINKTIRF